MFCEEETSGPLRETVERICQSRRPAPEMPRFNLCAVLPGAQISQVLERELSVNTDQMIHDSTAVLT